MKDVENFMNNENDLNPETLNEGVINHAAAGLDHLVILAKKSIADLRRAVRDCNRRIMAVILDFQGLAKKHGVVIITIGGMEGAVYRVEPLLEKARGYFFGMLAGLAAAIFFSSYFSMATMVYSSFFFLCIASSLVAILISIVTSLIFRAALNANADNPGAAKAVNRILVISGGLFLLLLALFGLMRFQTILAVLMPYTIVGLELSAICFAAAAECGWKIFRWSKPLSQKYDRLLSEREGLQDQLDEENATLSDLENRLSGRQYMPPPPVDYRLQLEMLNGSRNGSQKDRRNGADRTSDREAANEVSS